MNIENRSIMNIFTIRRFTIGITLFLTTLKQAFKRVTSIVHRLIVNSWSVFYHIIVIAF